MSRPIVFVLLFVCLLGISACAKVISKQEWSENLRAYGGRKVNKP